MKKISLDLSPDLLKIGKQDSSNYHRIIESTQEKVSYHADTTLRFFINTQTESYETHWHQATEMIMPLENHYRVIAAQQEYDLRPGDILIIPGGTLHQLIAPPDGLRLIYIFDMEAISGIRGYTYLTAFLSHPVLITPENFPSIYEDEASQLLYLIQEYFCGGHLRELNCYAGLLRFFANYGEQCLQQNETVRTSERPGQKQSHLYDRLNTVFDYMDQHYNEDLSLETVASVAGFSKYHFSRLFKQCSGYNFYDYLCVLRIRAAENLLLTPGLSITEVALQSGFSSLSTFNRTFKKKKGCTPSEYRELCSQKI